VIFSYFLIQDHRPLLEHLEILVLGSQDLEVNGVEVELLVTPTTEMDGGSAQPGRLESISAMPVYKDKSHEDLRWEDYQLGDKGTSFF
jgi:hypothetical protein